MSAVPSPQIQKVVLALGDYMNVTCHACIGGTNLREDMRRLEMGVQIIVGTPGRVYDMINRRVLSEWLFFVLMPHMLPEGDKHTDGKGLGS